MNQLQLHGFSRSGQPPPHFTGGPAEQLVDFSSQHGNGSDSGSGSGFFFPGDLGAPSSSSWDNHHHHTSTSTNSFNFSDLCIPVPGEEAAELEWLSNFVDDYSYPDDISCSHRAPPPAAAHAPPMPTQTQPAIAPAVRTAGKRPQQRQPVTTTTTSAAPNSGGNEEEAVRRRCTHCASERTPQWRTGPQGPKTLCNACGVRYKSGRLVPEYRPASSPTFVLTQHSNSHRKVMELRRHKELLILRHAAASLP